MKTIKLEDKTAKQLYKTASPEMKVILEENWGKVFFSESLMDRIKTMDDVYEELGICEEDILPYKKPKNKFQIQQNAFVKVTKIAELFNENWEADFTNSNQYKYFPYFTFTKGSGFGFADSSVWCACAAVPVCLYLKSRKISDFVGKTFIKEYQEYLG